MNSQTKTTENTATSNNAKSSTNQNNTNNQKKSSSGDANDFRQQVSELAATGASIAIRKAFDASLQSVTSGNNSNGGQMENINWRKLLVWVAISGVTIGVAKFLNSDTVDDFVK